MFPLQTATLPNPCHWCYLPVFWSHFIVFSIFFCKKSKIATHCWTTIDRRILDPTQKGTPCPRVKERLSKVPWTATISKQSILKELTPECSLAGLMLKLKLQYFGHLSWRIDSLEKTGCWKRLKVGVEGDDREWDGWMASPTRRTWVWASSVSWWWTGKPGVLQSLGLQRVNWMTELNWAELIAFSKAECEWTVHLFEFAFFSFITIC